MRLPGVWIVGHAGRGRASPGHFILNFSLSLKLVIRHVQPPSTNRTCLLPTVHSIHHFHERPECQPFMHASLGNIIGLVIRLDRGHGG